MNGSNDRWLWFIDDAPLQALMRAEGIAPNSSRRAASSPSLVRAVSLHLEGRSKEGLEELERAAASAETSPDVYGALGQLQFESRRFEDAARSYASQTGADPTLATAHFNLGVCLEKLKRWPESAESFRRALSLDAERIEAALALGLAELNSDQPDRAAEAFSLFLEKHPMHDQAAFGKAVSLHLAGRLGEAAAIYNTCLERTPNSPELLVNLISLNIAAKNHTAARTYSEQLLTYRPKSRQALEGLANAAFGEGDHEKAAQYSLDLTIAYSDSFEAWFNLGVARLEIGDAAGSADSFARAAGINPKEVRATTGLGAALERLGKNAEAIAAYGEARLITPLWNLAVRLGGAEAAAIHEKIVALDPGAAESWFELGSLRIGAGCWPEAAEAFEQCLRLKSGSIEAEFNAGVAYSKQGALVRAAASFDRVLQAQPENAAALKAAASIAIEAGDAAKGFDLHNRLVLLGQSTPEIAYEAAVLLQDSGRNEDAAMLYRQAVKQRDGFAEALVNLGHAVSSLGHAGESRIHWQKALALKPDLALAS